MIINEQQLQALVDAFGQTFGGTDAGSGRKLLAVRAPGRTEVAGNHTDHEGGNVIAAAIDRYVYGVFSPNGTMVCHVKSEGYDPFDVDLSVLDPVEDEKGASASLVRGVAASMAEKGFAVSGFDAYMTSGVPAGSGLSSSAAFELALASAGNALWADGSVSAAELALISQRAENAFFGKPCGLMDQAASALGGFQHMCFANPSELVADPIDFDLAKAGLALFIINVGADHSAKTDDYAAVPQEMQAVARELGHARLGEVEEADCIAALPRLRESLGDRACLRALHYWREERLVAQRAEALGNGDVEGFLGATRASGASSAMFLQNVSCGVEEQPAMLALAVSDELLCGRGASRIHGGGFGGTIQAFVPLDMVAEYKKGMDAVLGEGSCEEYHVEHEGATAQWL